MTRVLFLAGLGRSGTTLLERALAELPGVQPLGEVIHLWERSVQSDELCGCGEAFSRCPFWRAVGESAFGGWGSVDVGAIIRARARADRLRRVPELLLGRRTGTTRAARLLAAKHRQVYDAAAAVTRADVVVDSSKHPSLAHCLRFDPAIDLRVIHMVRDSRGVAYSWTKTVERPEARDPSRRWMTRYTPAQSAFLWSLHNAAVAVLARTGTPVMVVRYESFVRDPRSVLAAVARFADLAIRGADLSFASATTLQLTQAHTAAGNPLRFAIGTLPLKLDEAWRRLLPVRHRLAVAALTYPQLVRYGYVPRPRAQP